MVSQTHSDARFGWAWLFFTATLAIHVADEAVHDFISVFNANAQLIRERVPFLPIPTLTLNIFIGSLGIAIVLLLCLSPLAFTGSPMLRRLAIPLSIIFAIGNAILHLGSSLYFSRWMPGSFSSPLQLLSGFFLLYTALRSRQRANVQAAGL